jgi:hypothetical protein
MMMVMVLVVLVTMVVMRIVRITTRKNYTVRTRKEIQLSLQVWGQTLSEGLNKSRSPSASFLSEAFEQLLSDRSALLQNKPIIKSIQPDVLLNNGINYNVWLMIALLTVLEVLWEERRSSGRCSPPSASSPTHRPFDGSCQANPVIIHFYTNEL